MERFEKRIASAIEELSSDRTQVDPAQVEKAFTMILERQLQDHEQHPRRKPVVIVRVWEVVKGRENEWLLLEDFLDGFRETKNPRNSASKALRLVNDMLHEFGLEIHAQRFTVTVYKLRNRSK